MSGVTYDYQRIYEELRKKIEDLRKFTKSIDTDSMLYYINELENKYMESYSDDDLPF